MGVLLGVEFKVPSLEHQFRTQLHPRVREEILNLGEWSVAQSIPSVVVTEVVRTDAMQVDRYVPYARRLIAELRSGAEMDPAEKKLASALVLLSDQGVVRWAINKFTWHRCSCAVDLRVRHYTAGQLHGISEHIAKRCPPRTPAVGILVPGPSWEFLVHNIDGPHAHLAFRDPLWLAQWNLSRTVPTPEALS